MAEDRTFSVLLVDDDELMAKEHTKVCHDVPDVRVVGVAKNGAEAIKLVKLAGPDLVLMDLVMPDIDGFVALRLLMRGLPSTRIAVLSSRAEEPEVREQCRQTGAIAMIEKPLTRARLEQLIVAERSRENSHVL